MWEWIPLVVILFIIVGLVTFFIIRIFSLNEPKKKKIKTPKRLRPKDRNRIMHEANRRLAQNPKDPEGLLALAELYFEEGVWDKAFTYYNTLVSLCAINPEIDEFAVSLHCGLAALKLGNLDEAYKNLIVAKTFTDDNFELCFNLGLLEFTRQDYEKAVGLFKRAAELAPEHVQTIRNLGHSLFKLQRFEEALAQLQRVVELEPNDKNSMFLLAQCYYELGKNEHALTIFSHLRLDAQLGPKAALFAGTIHLNNKNYDKAIMDFEIGLKHKEIKAEIMLELKYRLAAAYIKMAEIAKALVLLEEIFALKPDYKDVDKQLSYYRELTTNKDLQTFLLAPNSEFLTLCRRIASNFFEAGKTKLLNITLNKSEYADILAEVHTKRWEDLVMFRFVRTTGVVGDMVVRDFYTVCKENRADRGFCITAGEFTESAKQFVEARLIDLIDKQEIVKVLKRIASITHV